MLSLSISYIGRKGEWAVNRWGGRALVVEGVLKPNGQGRLTGYGQQGIIVELIR